MSNVQVQNKVNDIQHPVDVSDNPFVTTRVVLWGAVTFLGSHYSSPELAPYHTKIVELYSLNNGEVAIFDGKYFICMAAATVNKPAPVVLAIGQRVIVKQTHLYGVVNHQCGAHDYYLVRLDGEINLRGFSGTELTVGDQQ